MVRRLLRKEQKVQECDATADAMKYYRPVHKKTFINNGYPFKWKLILYAQFI